MRRLLTFALPLGLLAAAPDARAQHWNDTGPGKDLLSSTIVEFDSFRQRAPVVPGVTPGSAAALPQQQARPPIPILDWVPPPPVATPPAPRRRTTTTRTRSRPAAPAVRDPAPLPTSAPASTASAGSDWERSLAERERELERLRRILEEDRLRYQQARQPQLR